MYFCIYIYIKEKSKLQTLHLYKRSSVKQGSLSACFNYNKLSLSEFTKMLHFLRLDFTDDVKFCFSRVSEIRAHGVVHGAESCYLVIYAELLALHFGLLTSIPRYQNPSRIQIVLWMHYNHSGTMADKLGY